MNTQKIASLYNQIECADSILSVDNGVTIKASVADLNGHSANEVIYFAWDDEVGNEYRIIITEEGLNDSFINDKGEIVLIDNEGDEFAIRLYEYKIIIPHQNW